MSAKIYTFTPTASAGKVNDLGSRVAVLENENPVKSVNSVEPDENGNVNISTVDYAYGIASDDAQSSDGTFICRTTGGSSSLSDGSAWLATIRGHSVHTGYVTESLTMTVNQAERGQSEEHMDVGISATIDRDTFVGYVTSSRTVTLTHNGTAWSADPALYGITVIGTPIANDKIVVVYVKEDRGTISNATPTAFVSTGWNIYDHSNGYARAVKYDDNAVFGISGAYSALKFSSTISGTKNNITVTNGRFTVPGDGYIWVTGGNNTTTAIWMTWSDWTGGYEGAWQAYSESTINISSLSASGHIFANGMFSIGGVADTIDFDLGTATSNIERMAYTAQNLETVIASGRTYDCDRNYIYVVRETPVTESFTINKEYAASDHGIEFFVGTEVGCYASMLYGSNLVEYLKHDVPQQINNISTDVSNLQNGLAIVANGNTHARVESGQFVYVRNHSSLADGLYSAKTAIEVNGSLSTSNLTAESAGGLNDLKGQVDSLNSNFNNMFTRKYRTYSNITIPSSGYIKVDSFSDMGVNESLYVISMNVRGWTGSIDGVTLGKSTNGTDFYLIGETNKTIARMIVEYVFSRY